MTDINTLIENGSDVAMAVLYGLQALLCVVLLSQLTRRREQRKVRGVFFALCAVGATLRAIWFAVPDSVFAQGYLPENRRPSNLGSEAFLLNALQFGLYSIPNCTYALNFILLICFWASLLHMLFSQRPTNAAGGGSVSTSRMEEAAHEHHHQQQQEYLHPESSFGGTTSIVVQPATAAGGTTNTASSSSSASSPLIAYRPAARFFRVLTCIVVFVQCALLAGLFVFDFFYVVMANCIWLCCLAGFALGGILWYAARIVRLLRPVYTHVLGRERKQEYYDVAAAYDGSSAALREADEKYVREQALWYVQQQQQQRAHPAIASATARGGNKQRPSRLVDPDIGGLDQDARDAHMQYGASATPGSSGSGSVHGSGSGSGAARGRSQLDQQVSRPTSHASSPGGAGSQSGRYSPHVAAPPPSLLLLHAQHLTSSSNAQSGGRRESTRVSGGTTSTSDELSYSPAAGEHEEDESDEAASTEDERSEEDDGDRELLPREGESAGQDVAASAAAAQGTESPSRSDTLSPGMLLPAAEEPFLSSDAHILPPMPPSRAHMQGGDGAAPQAQLHGGGVFITNSNQHRLFALQQRQMQQQQHAQTLVQHSEPSSSRHTRLLAPVARPGTVAVVSGSTSPLDSSPDRVIREEDFFRNGSNRSPSSGGGERASPHSQPSPPLPVPASQQQPSLAAALAARLRQGTAAGTGSVSSEVRSSAHSPDPYSADGSLRPTAASSLTRSSQAANGWVAPASHGGAASYASIHTHYGSSPLRVASPLMHLSAPAALPSSSASAADVAEESLALYAYSQTRKILLLTLCVVACSSARIAASLIELHYTWLQVQEDDRNNDDGTNSGVSSFPDVWWVVIDSYYLVFELLSSTVVAWLLTQSSVGSGGGNANTVGKTKASAAGVGASSPNAQHAYASTFHSAALVPGSGGWGASTVAGGMEPAAAGGGGPSHWRYGSGALSHMSSGVSSAASSSPRYTALHMHRALLVSSGGGSATAASSLGAHVPGAHMPALHARLLGGGTSTTSSLSSSLGAVGSKQLLVAGSSPRAASSAAFSTSGAGSHITIPPSHDASAHRDNLRRIFGHGRSR